MNIGWGKISLVIFVVLVAGCSSGVGPTGTGPNNSTDTRGTTELTTVTTTTEATTRTTTTVLFNCSNVSRPPTDPVVANVSQKAYPDEPANWSATGVRQFVVAFERSYMWNKVITRFEITNYSLGFNIVRVDGSETGYRVRMQTIDTVRTENLTAGGPFVVNYLVTHDAVVRNSTPGTGGDPDPVDGQIVHCFD